MALGLASRALRAYGRDTTAVRPRFASSCRSPLALGNHAGVAAALYALTNGDDASSF